MKVIPFYFVFICKKASLFWGVNNANTFGGFVEHLSLVAQQSVAKIMPFDKIMPIDTSVEKMNKI